MASFILEARISKIGVDQNTGRKPWASALQLISRNALASGSARLVIDAQRSGLLLRFSPILNWHGSVSNRWLTFCFQPAKNQYTRGTVLCGKAMLKDSEGKEIVDGDGQAASIPRCVTAARWTMIIGKDGRILNLQTDVSPANDSQEVLNFVHKMAAK